MMILLVSRWYVRNPLVGVELGSRIDLWDRGICDHEKMAISEEIHCVYSIYACCFLLASYYCIYGAVIIVFSCFDLKNVHVILLCFCKEMVHWDMRCFAVSTYIIWLHLVENSFESAVKKV